jgi:hypothetical protein
LDATELPASADVVALALYLVVLMQGLAIQAHDEALAEDLYTAVNQVTAGPLV